jgi:hypothetical protein
VTLGPDVDGLRVVDSGLGVGEVIVVNGLQRVRPGALVSATKVIMDMNRDGLRQVAVVEPEGSAGKASATHGRDATVRLSH